MYLERPEFVSYRGQFSTRSETIGKHRSFVVDDYIDAVADREMLEQPSAHYVRCDLGKNASFLLSLGGAVGVGVFVCGSLTRPDAVVQTVTCRHNSATTVYTEAYTLCACVCVCVCEISVSSGSHHSAQCPRMQSVAKRPRKDPSSHAK